MSADIVPFADAHIEPAADIVVAGYRRLLALEPALPPQWLDRAARASEISAAFGVGPGVAAVEDGGLVGFLIASLDLGGPVPETVWPSDASLGGVRSAAVRIGWHGVARREPRKVYRDMYASLADEFVAQQCFRHSVTVAICDRDAVEAWFGLGFGIDQITGSRDLAPLANPRPDLTIRRAAPTDMDALVTLNIEVLRHHTGSPSFLPAYFDPAAVWRDMTEAMQHPGRAVWVAEEESSIVGVMETTGLRRPSTNSARSRAAISVGMASVAEPARSRGVGTAILARVFDWAQSEGCGRCTVGWRSANTTSDPFWRSRGFKPVHYTLTRQIDERVTAPPANVR